MGHTLINIEDMWYRRKFSPDSYNAVQLRTSEKWQTEREWKVQGSFFKDHFQLGPPPTNPFSVRPTRNEFSNDADTFSNHLCWVTRLPAGSAL